MRTSWTSRLGLAAAMCLMAGASMSTATAAALSITFKVTIGSPCVSGVAPPSQHVTIRLTTPGGMPRGLTTADAATDGEYTGCFSGVSGIQGRDKLIATVGGQSRTWSVPPIVPVIDRVADTVAGRAPAGTPLHILVQDGEFGGAEGQSVERDIVSAPNGRYSSDFTSAIDIKGGSRVLISAPVGLDQVFAVATAPYLIVQRGTNQVVGIAPLGETVDLELRTSTGRLRSVAHATSAVSELFVANLTDADADPAYPRATDRVIASFASDARIIIPAWRLKADKLTDVVSGRCMSKAPFRLQVAAPEAGSGGSVTIHGTTLANGSFSRKVGPNVDVRAGTRLMVRCSYPTGDILVVTREVE